MKKGVSGHFDRSEAKGEICTRFKETVYRFLPAVEMTLGCLRFTAVEMAFKIKIDYGFVIRDQEIISTTLTKRWV